MSKNILIVDDEEGMCSFIKQCLEQAGFDADYVLNGKDAVSKYNKYDLIILDIRMPGMSGVEVLSKIKHKDSKLPVIIMSAFGDYQQAFELLNKGADDYLQKPFNIEDMLFRVAKTLEIYKLQKEIESYRVQARKSMASIVYKGSKMDRILEIVDKVAKETIPVLITGESGTGKELVARAVHYNTYNPRKEKPFWIVNCSALSETLLDDELFGHIKGAFTGANVDKYGLFEVAEGGTIFLDEIVDASPSTQAKLLRIVETGEFRKLGETRVRNADVRIIVATNKPLSEEVAAGKFRQDLYQRLKVVEINIPPLRERIEDIPELIKFFLNVFNQEFKKNTKLVGEVVEELKKYSWPGNVRELKHTIQKLILLSETEVVTLASLHKNFSDYGINSPEFISEENNKIELLHQGRTLKDKTFTEVKTNFIKDFERTFFIDLIKKSKGNISKAAQSVKMNRKYLTEKLKEYGIEATKYKK
jgi:DNA-binding NtrC family response regulator